MGRSQPGTSGPVNEDCRRGGIGDVGTRNTGYCDGSCSGAAGIIALWDEIAGYHWAGSVWSTSWTVKPGIYIIAPGLFQSGDALKKLLGLFSGNEAGETVNWISRIREALSGGGDDDGGGILDAFRDGALDKIKEHAQQAGENLVSSFRNPGEAVRLLGTKIRGLASAAFAPLVTSVRGLGGD